MPTGRHSVKKKASSNKPSQPRSSAPARSSAPRAKRNTGHAVAVIVVLVLIIAAAAFAVWKFVLAPSEPSATIAAGQEVTIEVTEGESSSQIAKNLYEAGLIERTQDFQDEVTSQGVADQLKVGTYRITGGTSVADIVALLVSGQTGYTLTIPEGYTAAQIAEAAAQTCEVDEDEFYKLTLKASSYVDDYPFLDGAYNDSLEGFLFPDTYTVEYGASADSIIRLMLDNFNAQVAQVDMSYASSKNLTVTDVVILASMVEKEAATSSDMPKISSVFYNRLHEGMNLGSDVTTYYAVGKDLTEELTMEDLASDSPYNTRNANNKGLPAGPICSPGLEALQAAAQPAETKLLYFFYSNSKEKTMFFKNEAAFNKAWAKYGD